MDYNWFIRLYSRKKNTHVIIHRFKRLFSCVFSLHFIKVFLFLYKILLFLFMPRSNRQSNSVVSDPFFSIHSNYTFNKSNRHQFQHLIPDILFSAKRLFNKEQIAFKIENRGETMVFFLLSIRNGTYYPK